MKSQTPTPVFSQYHRVLYGYKDIFGETLGREELVKRLSSLPTWPVVDTVSKLAVLLTNVDSTSLTFHLVQFFLNDEAKLKLGKQVQARNNHEFCLISDRSNCLLLEFCRHYCRSEILVEVDVEYLHKIGECILIANDLANEASFHGNLTDDSLPPIEKEQLTRKNYAIFSTREFLFNSSDQFRYTLARSSLAYNLFKDRVPMAFRFDLSNRLEEQLGFSLEDYFLTLLGICSYWANQSLDWETKYTNIDPAIIFPSGPRTEKFLKVLSYLSQDFLSDKEIPTEQTTFHEWQYKYFGLKSRPLLRYDGRIFCGSMKFLKDLFWQGPYFLVLNNFEKDEREKFFHYLGPAIETYVVDLLKDCLERKVKFPKTADGNPIGECVIEMRNNWQVVVEVKSGRADTSLQSRALDPALSPKTDQMLYDGLKQLSDRIREMRTGGYSGRISPLLITGGHFPINSVVWDHYLEKCKDLLVFHDSNVDFPQVMDLEAIETLCAFVKSGCRFGEILKSKAKPKWSKEDITIFFLNEWIPKFGEEPAHPILLALNSEIFNKLGEGLARSIEKFEVIADWRAVFSVRIDEAT